MTTVERLLAIQKMHQDIIDLGDEELYMVWIMMVPDEPSDWDFVDIAEDKEFFEECVALYKRLMKKGG